MISKMEADNIILTKIAHVKELNHDGASSLLQREQKDPP